MALHNFSPSTKIKSSLVNENFTGLANGSEITGTKTKVLTMPFKADNASGANQNVAYAGSTAFTGTPTGYSRGSIVIPDDYAGGDVTMTHRLVSNNTQTETFRYYIGSWGEGENSSGEWNVYSAQTDSIAFTANIQTEYEITIPAANVAANNILMFAIRIDTAITGAIYHFHSYIKYTGYIA